MRFTPIFVLMAAGLGCGSGVDLTDPIARSAELSPAVRVRNLAQARVFAERYLREHNLADGIILSDGIKSHSEGWSFLVLYNDSLIVGNHFFLRVLLDGTIIRTGGA
jgi:hypothetical protein